MLAGASGNEVVIRGDSPDAGAGHWDGIDLKNGALISNHAEIRHGGRYAGVGAYMATIAFGGLGPVYHCSSVDNTLIADSESVGIRIGDAYTDLVHVGSVGFEGIAGDPVQGVAAGPAVTTIEEALDCLR